MTYVALSRLKTIQGLFFKSKPFDRFEKINDSVMLNLRKIAEKDLQNLEIQISLKRFGERVIFNNSNSFFTQYDFIC